MKRLSILALLIVAGCAVETDSGDKSGPRVSAADRTEFDEVAVTTCERTDTIEWVTIAGTAKNGSSKRSDYTVELVVEDASGVQVDSTTAWVTNVEPGQTARWETTAMTDWVEGMSCRVVEVSRDASL